MKSKISLLVGIYPPDAGGPAIFAERFRKWCESVDINCFVITYATKNLNSTSGVAKIQLRSPRILSFVKFIFRVVKCSKDSEIIIANGCFLEVYLASFFLKADYVIKLPGDPIWEIARNRNLTTLSIEKFQRAPRGIFLKILQFFFNLAYRKAKYVICPSTQLFEFAQNWGVNEKNLRVIYNSVDPDIFCRSHFEKPVFDLVTTSRLVGWKNVEEIIRISASMHLSLAIAGVGPELDRLKRLSKDLDARVVFLGEVENREIPKILAKSRCFVLNSEFEATSYSLIEAKMMGLPVVARASAGSCEVIRHNIDGYLATSGEDIKLAISKIFSEFRFDEFSIAAREDALARFNQSTNFSSIVQILKHSNA